MGIKDKLKINKKLLLFMAIIGIAGIVAGAILVNILSIDDKKILLEYLNSFITNVKENKLDYVLVLKNNLLTNFTYLVLIWIAGISIVGLPVIVFIYFSKTFIAGFSVGSIIYAYKVKGLLLALFYIPGSIISIISILFLSMFGINVSLKILYSLLHKRVFDFKYLVKKYFKILVLCIIISLLGVLFDTFVMPYLVKLVI